MAILDTISPFLFFVSLSFIFVACLCYWNVMKKSHHVGFLMAVALLGMVYGLHLFSKQYLATQTNLYKFFAGPIFAPMVLVWSVLTLIVLIFSKTKRFARTLLMLSFIVAIVGDAFVLRNKLHWGFIILAISIGVAFIAVIWLFKTDSWRPRPLITWTVRRELVALILITGVTLFIKLYKFEDCLDGLAIDEAVKGRVAIDILEGKAQYMPYFYFRESPYFYLVALAMKFWGPRVVAMRMTSTVIAVAALYILYFLIRRIWGVEMAFVSSLFLTMSLWHNEESRITQRLVLVLPMQALIMYIVYKIYEDGKWWRFPVLGMAMAAAFYTYPPIRVLPGMVVLAFVYMFARRFKWMLKRSPLFILALIFFLGTIMAPLGRDAMKWHEYFLTNSKLGYHVDPWAKDVVEVKKNLVALYQTWHFRTAAFGTVRPVNVNIPLLDPVIGVLFVVGLGIALARSLSFPYFLFNTTFLIGLLPGILSWPFERRVIMSTLLAFTYAAMGFLFLWDQIRHAMSRFAATRTVLVFLIPLTLSIPLYTSWSILEERFYNYNAFKFGTAGLEFAATLRQNYEVIYFTNYFDPNTYIIACHDHIYDKDHPHMDHITHAPTVEEFVPYKRYLERNLAYIIDQYTGEQLADQKIREYYPDAIREEHYIEGNRGRFVVYLISQTYANSVSKTQDKQGNVDE